MLAAFLVPRDIAGRETGKAFLLLSTYFLVGVIINK